MLAAAAWLLSAAALAGLSLLLLAQVAPGWVRLAWPGLAHGAAGLAGLVLLLLGLRGPGRGASEGAEQFGLVAAGLVGAAVLMALPMLASRLRRRPPMGLFVGLHATLAVGGLVMLLGYLAA